jgi:hypothetical protein
MAGIRQLTLGQLVESPGIALHIFGMFTIHGLDFSFQRRLRKEGTNETLRESIQRTLQTFTLDIKIITRVLEIGKGIAGTSVGAQVLIVRVFCGVFGSANEQHVFTKMGQPWKCQWIAQLPDIHIYGGTRFVRQRIADQHHVHGTTAQ